MRNRSVLSIDLGSAYTKVAVRGDWHDESALLRELPLATADVDFCVPSVVARVEGAGATRWVVGAPAAAQAPEEGISVFRYWKARLFSDHPEEEVERDRMGHSDEPDPTATDYEEVAVQFFRGLRESLERAPLGLDLSALSARVCVPKLDHGDRAEARIGDILERAGLRPARGRATVYEPESNTAGVLTRGRNATWFPPRLSFAPRPGRSLQLREMLEPEGLLEALRRMTGSFGVLVIDIGGFTTDFGYVQFDTSFSSDDWQRPDIVQHSYELGIRELDQAIYASLGEEAQGAVQDLSSSEWDACKARLYAGERVTLRTAHGRAATVGAGEDAERIAEAMRAFSARVTAARDHFREQFVRGPINAQTLTGGGSMIAPIREILAREAAEDGSLRVYDLVDRGEPLRTLSLRAGPGREAHPAEVEARGRRNLELVRGGSAIGGSSVFFE